jgi:hypothetical protein
MVTHSSTSRPVQCLCMAERTGCPVLTDLWSYVLEEKEYCIMLWISGSRKIAVSRTLKWANQVVSRLNKRDCQSFPKLHAPAPNTLGPQ